MPESVENNIGSSAEGPATPQHEVAVEPSALKAPRDSSWLELQVCRDFNRPGGCPRNDMCRFAHPSPNMTVKNGKVTCCYDFLKDRCHRERCKYYHPVLFVKEQLVAAGKRFGAMVTYNIGSPSVPYPAAPMPQVGMDGSSLVEAPTAYVPSPQILSPYSVITERLQICPEFLRGQCSVQFCPFVHIEPHVRRNFDCTVTVCRDFVRMGCMRPNCRYFHPPPHILAQLSHATRFSVPQQAMYMPPDVTSWGSPVVYPAAGMVPPLQSFTPVKTVGPYGLPFGAAGMPIVTGVPVPTSPPLMVPTPVYPAAGLVTTLPPPPPPPPTSMMPPPVVTAGIPIPASVGLPLPLQLAPPPQPHVQIISGERSPDSAESSVKNDDSGIVSVHKSME